MSGFSAAYESRCAECDGVIRVGDLIVASDLETTADVVFKPWWAHETCPPAKFDIVRAVCGECFTERSVTGACMCEQVTA